MKLLIQEYLSSHSLAELESAFAIPAKRHREFSNLIMLKYSQINSPMSEPVVQQCRGIILDEASDWAVVSYPFDKFFNYGEPNAAAIDWPHATVYEKLDGSLMTLYWYRDQWRVASSGTPDAGGWAHESGITFAELFWRTWNAMGYMLPKDTSRCYMFELMTPENRVIIPHAAARLVLIGVRDLVHFSEHDHAPVAADYGWQAVNAYPLATLQDCVTAASKLTGLDGEGFVVRDTGFRRIKVKSPQYVALSHMKDTLSPRSMLEVIRKNESDEFLNYFPEIRPVYESVKAKYDQLCAELDAEYAAKKHIESQKDFALAIRSSRCSSALFALRNKKAATLRDFFAEATQQSVERALGITPEAPDKPPAGLAASAASTGR
jgi:hypothetical protein